MEQFAAYGHAVVSMVGVALIALILSPLSALRKQALGMAPGETPKADYGDAAYRWHRAYGNIAESAGTVALVIGAAILAGTSAYWVNLLASLYLVSRIVLVVVHIAGIGRPNMGPRSFTYVFGWLMLLIISIMTIIKVFV